MKASVIVSTICALLVSSAVIADDQAADEYAEARSAVADEFADPDSALFRRLRTMSHGGICGEVNAKNLMGAYVGYVPFHYYPPQEGEQQGRVMLGERGIENPRNPTERSDAAWARLANTMIISMCTEQAD